MKKGQASPRISPTWKIYFFLTLGLFTAIAFRALIIIDHLRPDLVRPLWYFAVMGNFLFFCYRYLITIKRKTAIQHFEHAKRNAPQGYFLRGAFPVARSVASSLTCCGVSERI